MWHNGKCLGLDTLTCINEWLLANKLSLNVVKTEFILIGSAHKLNNIITQPDLKINHVKIKQVGSYRTWSRT